MGEYDIDDENDTSVSDYDVEKIIIIHDQYNRLTKQNDIALIYLQEEVDFSSNIFDFINLLSRS